MRLSLKKLKIFGIISSLGVLLYFFHKKYSVLQDIHPVVYGFVLVVVTCISLNFLGRKKFGPTKKKKFNLSEQLPGLLIASVVLLIVIGFAVKSKAILFIAFGSFLPVWLYLAISTYFKPMAKTKKAIKEFSAEMGIPIIKKPTPASRFSEIFFTDLGKIPFDNVTNFIHTNSNFTIFCNSYSLPNPRRKGDYLPLENQMCFRFLISSCSSYHRIILRNDMTSTACGLDSNSNSGSTVKMIIPDIAENYIVLSKSTTEIKKIISKIQYELRKLVDIFPRNGQNFVLDNTPTNLDIHIARNEILARIPYQQGWLIDRLYLPFKEMQSILTG
jgi:hypothetical protein